MGSAGSRHAASDYSLSCYSDVMIFEFFMPLANEGYLRSSLDALFYKDSVMRKLQSIKTEELERYFVRAGGLSVEVYLDGICDWVSTMFGGYSISHVTGRFRSKALASLQDAYRYIENGESYLVDETTAIVKFIFPCGRSRPITEVDFEPADDFPGDQDSAGMHQEYRKIRYMFFKLFVQNIIMIVSQEDEIWMMESGMKTRLHSWRVPTTESDQ